MDRVHSGPAVRTGQTDCIEPGPNYIFSSSDRAVDIYSKMLSKQKKGDRGPRMEQMELKRQEEQAEMERLRQIRQQEQNELQIKAEVERRVQNEVSQGRFESYDMSHINFGTIPAI